jgi:hypothetical protein
MGRRVAPLVILLALLGATGIFLRSSLLGYPLVPRITERVWGIRLAARWGPQEGPITLLLPREDAQQSVGEERVQAAGLETSIRIDDDGVRQLTWWGDGAVSAGYEAELILRPTREAGSPPPGDDLRRWLRTDPWPPAAAEAAGWLAASSSPDQILRRCADWAARRASPPPDLAGRLERLRAATRSPAEVATLCLRAAGHPARIVLGFPLRAGIYTEAAPLAEVLEAGRWRVLDLDASPIAGLFGRRLVWSLGEQALVAGGGGAPVAWQLELRPQRSALWRRFFEQTVNRDAFLARWSLYQLPPDSQEILRILLLVPVGALLAALLRNVVGLNTFGTFMPILIAIAFRQTQLAYGLSLFAIIIAVGYLVRLGLERYKLLLVPRLSAILTFVIGCIAFLALLGHHLALRNVIAVGLFPIVILAMTIERFHVVAEESGGRTALGMAARTLAVAAAVYGLLAWDYLQLLFFTYPELLLLVAAAQIALGRYVGFRLTELTRFRRIAEGS